MNFFRNTKMEIVLFCILKFIFISIASSQSGAPTHVCEYAGHATGPVVDIPFSVSNVPERCELITYGGYYIGSASADGPLYKSDEAPIKSLLAAGKPVYIYFGFSSFNASWSEILDCKDQAAYDKLINPFIAKVQELKVTGVILNILNLYNDLPDMANKICAFVTKLKEQLPDLKFGLNVFAFFNDTYTKIPNKDLFDYSITNAVIDMYFIDTHAHGYVCTPELSQSGTIITSADKTVKSLELLSTAISQSTMDQAKTIACISIFPLAPNSLDVYTSYSKYCSTPEAANSDQWCIDDPQKLYDIGAFVKGKYAAIAVDWIEFDDVDCTCQCSQAYPVTNTVFDGWDGIPITPCPKMN